MKMMSHFSEDEIRAEMSYRYNERIALSCGAKEPCQAIKRMAMDEAKAWEAKIRQSEQFELFADNAKLRDAGESGVEQH